MRAMPSSASRSNSLRDCIFVVHKTNKTIPSNYLIYLMNYKFDELYTDLGGWGRAVVVAYVICNRKSKHSWCKFACGLQLADFGFISSPDGIIIIYSDNIYSSFEFCFTIQKNAKRLQQYSVQRSGICWQPSVEIDVKITRKYYATRASSEITGYLFFNALFLVFKLLLRKHRC